VVSDEVFPANLFCIEKRNMDQTKFRFIASVNLLLRGGVKMKIRNLILSACFILLLFLLPGECFSQYDPGIPDTVSIEAPIIHLTGPPYQGNMLLPIAVFNDETVAEIDIPLTWNGPISCDSGKYVGERPQYFMNSYFSFNNQERWVVGTAIGGEPVEPYHIPPGQGDFLYIYFSIQDTGFVSIDTLRMFGFLYLRIVDDSAGRVIIPHFTPVQIHIRPQLPGDVNHDGQVDVGDVVFLINYLFRNSIAPEPIESGDVNGDCAVDIGDVVYLINYLFKGGDQPQTGCS
jgi:hypothetical protein